MRGLDLERAIALKASTRGAAAKSEVLGDGNGGLWGSMGLCCMARPLLGAWFVRIYNHYILNSKFVFFLLI